MKAVRIHSRGGPEVLSLEEVEVPRPGAGQVLIKVAAAGVNQADIGQRNGRYPNLVPLPTTLGYEVAGTLVASGPGVTGLRAGLPVMAHVEGGYAEYALALAGETTPIPDGISFEQAAALPIQGQTAYLMLARAARLARDESVLVHAAAGGVGAIAVQLAQLMGARVVIGTGRTDAQLSVIAGLGAGPALDLRRPDWLGQVRQITGGRGVDIALDAIGGDILQPSLAALAPFGRLVVFGSLSGQSSGLAAQQLIGGCQAVLGFNTPLHSLAAKAEANRTLLGHLAAGRLRVATRTVPLEEVAKAHELLERAGSTGKVVLVVG